MSGLWPLLRHQPGETPISFVSRLAALHGTPLREFCRDLGLRFQGIVDGSIDAIQTLADLTRTSLADLADEAVRRTGLRTYVWRGEALPREALRRSKVMVCPRCLLDDMDRAGGNAMSAPHNRAIWQIAALNTCFKHETALVIAAIVKGPRHLHDFAHNSAALIDALRATHIACEPRRPSSLEAYLMDRLRGMQRGHWLDGLPWHAAIETCRVIGAVSAYGRAVRLRDLDEGSWHVAGDIGFAVVHDGADGYRELLGHLDATYARSRRSSEGPKAVYGSLHYWLYKARDIRPDIEPIREIMRQHVIETYPVGPGDVILGEPVTRRDLHSVYTASVEYEIHPKRLRKILRACGIIGATSDGRPDNRVLFGARAASDLLSRSKTSVCADAAKRHLNTIRMQVVLLTQAGFISPLVVLHQKGRSLNYALADLDDFLTKLTAAAEPVQARRTGEYTISDAARRARCSAMDIVGLILHRKLPWTGQLAGQRGYMSVLVRLDEVKALVRKRSDDGLTARRLASYLRTSSHVVKSLVSSGHFTMVEIVNPVSRCAVRVVPPDEAERFRSTYVSIHELSLAYGIHCQTVENRLERAGITPAITREAAKTPFYVRSSIEPRHLNY